LFDNDTSKIGERTRNGIEVFDVKQIAKVVRDESIDVAVIAVPARIAQKVLNQVMAAGVKAILNFAPVQLTVPPDVAIKSVNLTLELETLSYALRNR